MNSLISKLTFSLTPYEWQFTAMKNAEHKSCYALLAEVGSGKTGAMINILRLKCGHNVGLMRTVIFTPLITLYNWQDEFKMHSNIDPKFVLPLAHAAKRNKSFEKQTKEFDKSIIIVNYEALLNENFFKLLQNWKPEVIIADEMHYIKNYRSKRAKALFKLAVNARLRYGMTGTPILNSPMDIFMQFKFLDLGASFGTNFFRFRARYFQDVNAAWSDKKSHFPKFEFIPSMVQEFNEKIYQSAIRVTKEQCLDLPPLIKKTIKVPLSKEQQKHYDTMKRDFIAFIESETEKGTTKAVVAQIALTKALRLQQICCGYMTTEDGEEINMKDVPRLKIVKELLEQITPDHKVILWCSFKNNYKQLGDICEALNLKHGFITGSMSLDAKKETMDNLKNDPDFKVVIANRRAGGIGINLIEASYSIVFSRNFSLGEEIQSEARNYRGGSQIHERITKLDLCAPDTIDETVLAALKSKQKISDQIIDLKL